VLKGNARVHVASPKHTYLATHRQLLESSMFLEFFERVEVANFEIASDAFATFKVGCWKHRAPM
jgi:hypothetical protein